MIIINIYDIKWSSECNDFKSMYFHFVQKILFVTEKNYIVHSKSGNWTLVPNFIKEKPKK